MKWRNKDMNEPMTKEKKEQEFVPKLLGLKFETEQDQEKKQWRRFNNSNWWITWNDKEKKKLVSGCCRLDIEERCMNIEQKWNRRIPKLELGKWGLFCLLTESGPSCVSAYVCAAPATYCRLWLFLPTLD